MGADEDFEKRNKIEKIQDSARGVLDHALSAVTAYRDMAPKTQQRALALAFTKLEEAQLWFEAACKLEARE